MKIESILINNNIIRNINPQDNFSARINLHAEQNNDEYYWHHLTQLQNSELNFRLLKKSLSLKKEFISQNHTENLKNNAQFIPTKYVKYLNENKAYNLKYYSLYNPNELSKSSCSNFVIKNLFYTHPSFNFPKNVEIVLKRQISLTNSYLRLINFNHFHLFISNNKVELSLNFFNLLPEEYLKAKQEILKWLKIRGYRLAQLIINGVKQ